MICPFWVTVRWECRFIDLKVKNVKSVTYIGKCLLKGPECLAKFFVWRYSAGSAKSCEFLLESEAVVLDFSPGVAELFIFDVPDPPADEAECVEVLLRSGSDIKGHLVSHGFSGPEGLGLKFA